MKKDGNHHFPGKKWAHEMFLTMKLTFLFLCCLSLQLPARVFSQQVTLRAKGATFQEIAKELERQTGYTFLYNIEQVNELKRIDIDVRQEALEQVLRACLHDTGLSHRIVEKTVVIIPATREPVAPQERRVIRGKVTDPAGDGLPGVTILLKGSTYGTATDPRGEFTLLLPSAIADPVLRFSFTGMKTKEITVTTDKPLTVILEEEVAELEDVVVTGYANIRKSSFTGTATRVTREELMKVSTGNVLQALQVFDPSLRTVRNNEMGSDPNTLPEFNIRGAAGVGITDLDRLQSADVSQFALKNNPNLPVFILDGYEVSTEKIYDMDPNRIESITILKDAAATAMYGSRAANGVIVIETVAPKPGQLRVSYNLTGTVTTPDLSSYNLMNAREKIEAELAAGLLNEPVNLMTHLREYRMKMNNIERGVDSYWLSQPLRTEFNHRHGLYVEGGAENVRFGIGLNYAGENGVMKKSFRDRTGAELKVDYRFKDLQITNNVSYTRMSSRQSPYGEFSTYVKLAPYLPLDETLLKNEGDQYYGMYHWNFGDQNTPNPLEEAKMNHFDRSGYNEFSNNLSVNARFLAYFQLKFQFAVTYRNESREKYTDPASTRFKSSSRVSFTPLDKGELVVDKYEQVHWNSNLMLMYNRYIRDHNLNVTLILNAKEDKSLSEQVAYRGFPSGQFHDPQYAHEIVSFPSFSDDHSRLVGTSLQGNYSYKETYLLDLSARRDGSSKFGSKQRFGSFWSLGAGINLHHYDFMKAYPFVQEARVKINYGQTGRVSFPSYASRDMYRLMMDDWYTTGMGSSLMAMGNEQLTWDKVNTVNVGLDVSLWKRLLFNVSFYDKRTHDMVTSITIPSATGFTSYMENVGEVSNRGYEFNLNLALVKTRDWNVNVSANGAHNVNKIVKISGALKEYNDRVDRFYDDYRGDGGNYVVDDQFIKPIRKYYEGGSEFDIFGMRSLGISPENGEELFLNRDGSVSFAWDAAQQSVIGNTEPALQGALSLNARYRAFSLYTTFMYEFGGDLYNATLVENVESVDITRNNADRRATLMRWQKPGDIAPLRSIKYAYAELLPGLTRPTSRFVQKNNTLTFNSLTLSYDMDRRWSDKFGLSMLRFSISMNDIAVFSTIHQERGTSYPFARRFGFTLNAGF
jgi:TonB-linked SusC/RagA family outer membrane protein